MNIKRSLLVGVSLATLAVGAGAVNLVSADTISTTTGSSIVDKIATKFNLKKADVQAVFDADRATHQAQMEADQKQKLADAVSAGKLTQAQADYITNARAEIKTLMGNTDPHDQTTTVHDQIREKFDALRQWASDNNVDEQYVMGPRGGHGGPRGMNSADTDSDSTSSSSSSNN